jgi:hypothetical protein
MDYKLAAIGTETIPKFRFVARAGAELVSVADDPLIASVGVSQFSTFAGEPCSYVAAGVTYVEVGPASGIVVASNVTVAGGGLARLPALASDISMGRSLEDAPPGGGLIRIALIGVDTEQAITFIEKLADFPEPVAGVITLEDAATYWIVGDVDLLGARLLSGADTVLIGSSSENSSLRSTGLVGTALLTSTDTTPVRHLSFTADIALDLNGDGTTALDWFGVNFVDCGEVGTIANYANVIMISCAFLNSGSIKYDGTIGTVACNNCIWTPAAGETGVELLATVIITRRFRIIYSAIVAAATATGVRVDALATIPVESYILDTVSFGGAGTHTAGVDGVSDSAKWVACTGVTNSAVIANLVINANATLTTFTGANAPAKVLGVSTVATLNQRFAHDAPNNALEYTATLTRVCRIQASFSLLAQNNRVISCYIAVDRDGSPLVPATDIIASSEVQVTGDGTRPETCFIQAIGEINQGDKIYCVVENNTDGQSVTVGFLNLIVERASL